MQEKGQKQPTSTSGYEIKPAYGRKTKSSLDPMRLMLGKTGSMLKAKDVKRAGKHTLKGVK